eukprot:scaffold311810_cov31-Prasinocladus_malaysianus.AAC.1
MASASRRAKEVQDGMIHHDLEIEPPAQIREVLMGFHEDDKLAPGHPLGLALAQSDTQEVLRMEVQKGPAELPHLLDEVYIRSATVDSYTERNAMDWL